MFAPMFICVMPSPSAGPAPPVDAIVAPRLPIGCLVRNVAVDFSCCQQSHGTMPGMRHFAFMSDSDRDRLFLRAPEEFTLADDPSLLGAALGGTLYCPATR